MVGRILQIESALLVLPLIVSIIYYEATFLSFVVTILITLAAGTLLRALFKPKDNVIYAKEGFVIVALTWISLSAFGALPFWLSSQMPSYIDALFETVSGFTTTGASILTDVTALDRGMLFWRSFTHFIGGMGIIVLVMAIFTTSSGRAMHIMRAEMPGPIVGKLVPRVRDTAKILYLIYIALTLVETVFLVLGDMDLFESIVHSLGTAGTGGFGIKPDSIGSYSSYSQWVITVFMLIFGINFNLFYLIIIGRIRTALKSEELRVYIGVVVAAGVAIAINISNMYSSIAETLKYSFFQVASIITTTGYATVDFDLWPTFSKAILFTLMFMGGCAGSTAGGLKVSRIVLMVKMVANDLKKTLHPRAVNTVQFEGKPLDEQTHRGVTSYFLLYITIFFTLFLALSLDTFDFETNFTAITSCFNNIGPGLSAVGPALSYAAYSAFSKIVLTLAMLLGRLEIYPILVLLIPAAWSKNNKSISRVNK